MHQRLVALAVHLQLAERATSDPGALTSVLQEMRRDIEDALETTSLLGQWVHPPSLGAGGLAALLRLAALNAGVPASVEVAAGSDYPPEIGMTVYLCWLDALARGSGTSPVAITVAQEENALAFETVGGGDPDSGEFDRARDRVDALGGHLRVESTSDGRVRVTGSLPVSR